MSAKPNDRTKDRAKAAAERDHARRVRNLALTTAARLASQDATISGFTVVQVDGSVEYLDAALLRRGGRA